MNIMNVCIKIIVVSVFIGFVTVAFGRELCIRTFTENNTAKTRINAIVENEFADVEFENAVIGGRKTVISAGNNGNLPFLCNGIKYNCINGGDEIVFYNSNQTLVYSVPLDMIVYFEYTCVIGDVHVPFEKCQSLAKRAVYSAFSHIRTPVIKDITVSEETDEYVAYFVETDIEFAENITVALRKDTGSVIYYCVRDEE